LFTAPEVPVNLQVTEQTAHAVQLMWQHPNITNGKVKRFDIRVKLVSSHLRRMVQEVNVPERVLEVQQPSRNYSYVVSESWYLHFV
jgi:spore germination protein GerM